MITRDPDTGAIGDTANIAFGIRVQPLDDQQELIEDIRERDRPAGRPGPPEGTEVELAGLPVIAAEANADLDRSRYWLPAGRPAAVALVLLAVYRSARRALVPLVPIVLATGWSALVVAAMDVPLNPMSATLGALVIAIATEFSVILAARYEQRARRRPLGRRGAAAHLRAHRRRRARLGRRPRSPASPRWPRPTSAMLRDFGLVTVADLGVALAGVMLVLPAALVWAEEGFPLPLGCDRPRGGPRPSRHRGPVGPGAL